MGNGFDREISFEITTNKNPQPLDIQRIAGTYTRQDSNLWPSESESDALSN